METRAAPIPPGTSPTRPHAQASDPSGSRRPARLPRPIGLLPLAIAWGALLLAVLPAAVRSADGAGPRLPAVRNFACYYGEGHAADLSRYDLVILEPSNQTTASIRTIRSKGTIAVGYVSIGETSAAPPKNTPTAVQQPSADGLTRVPPFFLDLNRDGKVDRNGEWGSYFVDAGSPAWQQKVLDELVPAVVGTKGCDGVFLDTIDTAEAYPETKPGMAQLVRKIRSKYPRMPIVANRGFAQLDELAPHVDAFLFECFTTTYEPSSKRTRINNMDELSWADEMVGRIRARKPAPQVFILDYDDSKDPSVRRRAVERARAAGLVYSISTGQLDRLPLESPGVTRR